MNPKSFPKRLDSRTSCLRITVPENLDLALEGLIRKVLREQPKTDDIYAFAANYFETLLRIRDKAGAEYTVTQLCPFHNDEEAREMIVLAGTFPRQVPGRMQGKGPAPLKPETKKETDKAEPEKGLKRSKETLKDSNPEIEKKQMTPDLIKKLPLLAQNQSLNGEGVGGEKTTDMGPDRERTETIKEGGDEEEYLMSDPIKEFVEKELLTEGNRKEQATEGEDLELSERGSPSPTAREEQNGETEGGAPMVSNADENKGADGGYSPEARDSAGVVIHASEDRGKRKIDPEVRDPDEKGVEAGDVAEDAEDKIEDAAQPEAEGERPLQETQKKEEKENEEETSKLRAEEESQNKMGSAPEMEAEPEGVEAPLPPLPPSPAATETHAQEPVHEVSPSYNTEADVPPELEGGEVTQSADSSEVASPHEKGKEEVGVVQQPTEDESETDAQPSSASPMKTDEESPETCSLVTNSYDSKPAESNDVRATETDKSQKTDMKEGTNGVTESIACVEGEVQDLATTNSSETVSSSERAKGVQEVKEGVSSFEEEGHHQAKGGQLKKGRENQDTKAYDPSKPDLKSAEEGAKLTSASRVDAEDATGQPQTGAEGSIVKAKDESLTERRQSPGNQTLPEELALHTAEDIQCAAEAAAEESTEADGRRTPLTGISSTTEGPESEERGEAKQEAPKDISSPTGDSGRLTESGEMPEIATRETESAKSQEFEPEDAPTAENETESLANEELCSVVDINHLKKDGGNQEEPKLAKPQPENTAEEKSAPETEGSPPPSLSPSAANGETWRVNRNDKLSLHQESEAEDTTEGKAESEEPSNATAVQEPVKSETDKEKGYSAEGTPQETWEGFDPSAEGKKIIIVEEPATAYENSEESSPPGEIQIKTIQTHYYDALRVPETVTREYRVHEMVAPTTDGLRGAASPPPSTQDEVQESPGDEERSVPPTPKTSPTSDGDVSSYAEVAEAQSYIGPPYHPSHVGADALLTMQGFDRDAQVSDSEDLPHQTTPTSEVASNLAEFSLRAASEIFLTNEKRFSSLEKDEIRFVTPTTEEARSGEPEGQVIKSRWEIGEVGDERALPSAAGARPAPQTPGKTEAAGAGSEGAEDSKKVGSSGGSTALGDGRAAKGDSTTDSASENPVSEARPQGEDESGPDAPRLSSGVNPERAEEESFHLKTQERNVLESCPEEGHVGSRCDDRRDGLSTERTPTAEASYAESESMTSSATTGVKRADSARRDFARCLSSARSLDLGKRSPLQRTRSLSTNRHGVADFEVWSTIEKELEEAATKIQSKFRGYKTRKKLRREVAVQISTEESSKRSTPVEADDADNRPRATGEFHDGIVLAEHPR